MQSTVLKHHNPGAKPDVADDTPKLRKKDAENAQVAVPDAVNVSLPKEPATEIAVPASINEIGRASCRERVL